MTEYHCDSDYTARIIEQKVACYCEAFPEKGTCSRDDLPLAIKALSSDLQQHLVFEFGGMESYWAMMCCAARTWVTQMEDSKDFRTFRGFLKSAAAMCAQVCPDEKGLFYHNYHQFKQWRQSTIVTVQRIQ